MFNLLKKIPRFRRRIRPADLDALYDRVNQLSKVTGSNGISITTGPGGISIRNRGSLSGAPQVYEVINVPTGDGTYPCYKDEFDSTDWNDTTGTEKFDQVGGSYYVFNLLENNPDAAYTAATGINDKMIGWKVKDDEGNVRVMGLPIDGAQVRMARTTEAAPAATNITCNLIGFDGAEITASTGSAIEVYCKISGGGNLDDAIPRLANDDYIFVCNLRGVWYCTTVFQASEDCDCYTEP